jgi:hypothetical protein
MTAVYYVKLSAKQRPYNSRCEVEHRSYRSPSPGIQLPRPANTVERDAFPADCVLPCPVLHTVDVHIVPFVCEPLGHLPDSPFNPTLDERVHRVKHVGNPQGSCLASRRNWMQQRPILMLQGTPAPHTWTGGGSAWEQLLERTPPLSPKQCILSILEACSSRSIVRYPLSTLTTTHSSSAMRVMLWRNRAFNLDQVESAQPLLPQSIEQRIRYGR